MGAFVAFGGTFAVVLTALATIFKTRRTIQPNELGVMYRLGKAVMTPNWVVRLFYRLFLRSREVPERTVKVFGPGPRFGIPGMFRVVPMAAYRITTDEEVIAVQRPGGLVSFAKITLVYDITKPGVRVALTKVDNYHVLVRSRFHHLVGNVLQDTPPTRSKQDRERLARAILEEVRTDPGFEYYETIPQAVNIIELVDTPTSQMVQLLGELADKILAALAIRGWVVVQADGSETHPSNGNGGNGHVPGQLALTEG